jgi:phosphatidylethanolamine-binding protein (PEBP) family uncharacterized protein
MNLQRFLAFLFVTTVLVVLCGCGQSAAEREFQQMIEQTKQRYKASDIKTAVTPLFSKYQQNGKISFSDLPKEITSLPLFVEDPKDIQIWTTRSESDALVFATGGGFGHWGIVVCRLEKDRKVEETMGYRLTSWESGVYFFRE